MGKALLTVKGVSVRFGALQAVDAVSLDLYAGEIHALIGPNGAGKSTLIKLIAGDLVPDAGTVFFLSEDLTHSPTPVRARAGLARTFQISELAMEARVFDNAVLGALGAQGGAFNPVVRASTRKELTARARAALDRVGLSRSAGRRTADLSHGERRQLEVAVALTLAPRAFLMDEPMAGLGADGTSRMTALLSDLRSEAPILLVEHDMDVVFRLADRISVLDYGRLIASGTPGDIRADPAVRAAYLGDGG
ncbi:MAG: ABC transporter ATP-binding protein [Pseudomonadota bacterium]